MMREANARVSGACKVRRSRVLACEGGSVFLSRGYRLFRSRDGLRSLAPVADLPASLAERLAGRSNLLTRFGRLGFQTLLRTPSGALVAIARKRIVCLEPGSARFRVVQRIERGSRPLGMAVSPDGFLVSGEYWANPDRLPLRVFASTDDGQTWQAVYTFPARAARHIHNVLWDGHRNGFWVLTGDRAMECAIYFTADRFRTVQEVARGQQLFRACAGFCMPDGLYYGTDTELERNWIVRLEPGSGRVEKIHALEGSSLYAARMAGRFYLSTCVEISEVNRHDRATLWESPDLLSWDKVCEWKKDRWGKTLFQFGNIILPSWTREARHVAVTGVGVRGYDCTTVCLSETGTAE